MRLHDETVPVKPVLWRTAGIDNNSRRDRLSRWEVMAVARRREPTPPVPQEEATRTAFGQWLQHLRQKRGFGVRELAGRIGKEHSYVYALETGRLREPSMASLVALSRELGVSLLEVIRRLHGAEVEEALRRAVAENSGPLAEVDPEVRDAILALVGAVEQVIERRTTEQVRASMERLVNQVLGERRTGRTRFWSESRHAVPVGVVIPFPRLPGSTA